MTSPDIPKSSNADIEKLSPEKLLWRFSRSGIVVCIVFAFAVHVVVLGGTSVDYIHGLVDPAWKAERERLKAEARKLAEAERQAQRTPARPKPGASQPASRPASRPGAKKPAAGLEAPDGRKVPRELQELPKPGELPKAPRSGIGIDETEGQ